MSAPNLNITVEPSEGGSVVFLSLAPRTTNDAAKAQLSLVLTIKNNEAQQVHVNQLVVSFIGPPNVGATTIPIDLNIGAHQQQNWFFETANNITLPVPAPSQIKLSLSCDGFSSAATTTKPLTAHQSPVPGGGYDFPAKASDLRVGEYWFGQSETHASGFGSQLFAYDMGVAWFDPATLQWNDKLPGKDGTKNEHYRIWGKPICAIAEGKVVGFKNDMANNTHMGTQDPTPNPVEGNHFWIQHGTEVALYAHLQKGSLKPNLMQINATVHRGDFLGLAGNSGNSTNPHLHTHVMKGDHPWGGPLRPMPFSSTHMIDRTVLHPPDPAGPWVKAQHQGLPNVTSAIWPTASKPAWYPPGWAVLTRHGISESAYQTEFDHIASSGYRLVWIDGYDVKGKTFFNVIFRAADGLAWTARHGLDGNQYQQEFNSRTNQGFRLMHIESYISGGQVCYAPIFVQSSGPAWVAYHGRTADQHQQEFNTLSQQGFRPITISAVSPSGERTYAGLYEKRDVGGFILKSFMTPSEYQTQFDQNVQAGRQLAYLNVYTHQGSPRVIAIWTEKAASPFIARHGLSNAQYQAEFDQRLSEGFFVRAVTGYQEGSQERFAAFWTR